jgi:hypothetical protein
MTKLNFISILECPSTSSIVCFREEKRVGGIFALSKFGKYLETNLGITKDKQLSRTSCLARYVIVGNEASPLKSYLMRPYAVSQSVGENENSIYNYRISQARKVVENTFGTLRQKFQIIKRPYNHCRRMRITLFL